MLFSRTMTLANGTRLGPYEIRGALGAGGMGEVYRALDPRLSREVAVKVLPRAVAGDPERQKRFESEARAAGALNHPNIITLHDVGIADGTPYLVTEILEGEPLRAVIDRGPLAPPRASAIVTEIAQGLSAAHAKGIVHRDLKPENLFVLPDGRVKILDFGIAKLTRGEAASEAETTPAFASLTAAGTILGTVSYMAPEQLRDRPVDQRADLFALGAIFHELLTGKQPFAGDTAADRVTAILTAEPPPIPPAVEGDLPGVSAVIARLLAKRPEGRFDTARDLAFTLEILAGRKAQAVVESAGSAPPVSFRPLTFHDGMLYCARFAPDGQTVVYQGAFGGEPSDVYLTRLELPDARPLGLRDATLQAVSSTAELAVTLRSRDIGGFIRLGTLARLPMVGGRPRELADDVFQAAFAPDGKSLAAIRAVGDSYQLEAPLGTVIHKTKGWMSHPRYSPDGTQIAFLNHPWIGSNGGHVCVIRPGEEPRRLTENIPTLWKLAWRPDGQEIWFTGMGDKAGEGILATTLDGTVRIVYAAPGYLHIEDLAANGEALLDMTRSRMRLETSTRARGASAATDLSWMDWSLLRDLSDDGSLVLFDETGSVADYGVFLRTVDGAPAVRLADGVCASSLSRDGRFVLGRRPGGSDQVHVIPIGVGQVRTIGTGDCSVSDGDWLPDGSGLIVSAKSPEGRHLYHLDLGAGSLRRIHEQAIKTMMLFVSPDGSHVLSRGTDSLVTIFPVDGSEPRSYPDLTMDWKQCGWGGDSRHFFAFRAGAVPAPVVRVDIETGAQEPWMEVMPMVRSGVDSINALQLDRSAERYACCYISNESHLYYAQGLR